MADFQDRLIEDLGHEISDVVIAGEELLLAPANPEDPLQFAREFRSLLATLEMGVKLLQWDDLAAFFTGVCLKLDAAFFLDEPADAVRSKMEKTLRLILDIHGCFDGLRFTPEQLSGWYERLEKIWESNEGDSLEPAHRMEKSADTEKGVSETMASEVFSTMPPKESAPSSSGLVLAVEMWGQEFLYPLDSVTGMAHLSDVELSEKTMDGQIEFQGKNFPISRPQEFRSLRISAGVDALVRGSEFIFLETDLGVAALNVDRIMGIKTVDVSLARPANSEAYQRMPKKGHLAACWLYSP